MKKRLKGRTALVTGGSKRLGKAIALALASEGADVCIHFRSSVRDAKDTVTEIREQGVKSWLMKADLMDPEQARHIIADGNSETGRPFDILVNNASVFEDGHIMHITDSDLMNNINLHAVAPLYLSRTFAAQKGMKEGDIINMLDTRIVDYDSAHAAYHISKRMLFTLTRMLAQEFAPDIKVNAIAPGLIMPPPGKDEEYLTQRLETNPLKKHGTPEDIGNTAVFLVCNSFITGQVVYVDGGRHMKGNMYG